MALFHHHFDDLKMKMFAEDWVVYPRTSGSPEPTWPEARNIILSQCTVLHLIPVKRLDIMRHVLFKITNCFVKMAWKYVKEVNDSLKK